MRRVERVRLLEHTYFCIVNAVNSSFDLTIEGAGSRDSDPAAIEADDVEVPFHLFGLMLVHSFVLVLAESVIVCTKSHRACQLSEALCLEILGAVFILTVAFTDFVMGVAALSLIEDVISAGDMAIVNALRALVEIVDVPCEHHSEERSKGHQYFARHFFDF